MKKGFGFLGACLAMFLLLAAANRDDLFLISKNLDIFSSLYKEVSVHYVEETNSTALMRKGIDAILSGLDPYTEYIPESEVEAYRLKYVSTQFGGIGAATILINGRLFVNEVVQGYPAAKAKMLPGDEIVRIDSLMVKGKSREEIGSFLRGPRGTQVMVQVARGADTLNFNLQREIIVQKNVTYYGMVEDNVGYIKLEKFLENAALEVKNALVELSKQQPNGIILDLRNNGGGILQEAVKIVNLFVKKDQLVVTQRGRNSTIQYKTTQDPVASDVPLVILINGASASASEIVAGAMQDLDRAVVVGQNSFGKGLVQQTFNLPYNSLVKVTVAKYYTPSGRCIQALDYANKEVNGFAHKYDLKLRSSFNTKSGRMVYDGNGLYPDIPVAHNLNGDITNIVLNKGLFFDFANLYKKQNKQISPADEFRLSDEDYKVFLNTIPSSDRSFSEATDKVFEQINAQAKVLGKTQELKTEIDAIKKKLSLSTREVLLKHKEEVKKVLETQVIARYYDEKGKHEQAFQYDLTFQAAANLFKEPNKFKNILSGKGEYKTIGNIAD